MLEKMKFVLGISCVCLSVGLMGGCSLINTENEGTTTANNISSTPARIRTSSYSLPFEITYDKLTRNLSDSDSICVVTARDLSNGVKTYKNSGALVTHEFYNNFSQYSLLTKLLPVSSDASAVQDQARTQGCSLIAIPKVDSWSVDMVTQRDMRVTLQMFDVSSLSLVNSFALNAQSSDDILSAITYLVHKLYFPK